MVNGSVEITLFLLPLNQHMKFTVFWNEEIKEVYALVNSMCTHSKLDLNKFVTNPCFQTLGFALKLI